MRVGWLSDPSPYVGGAELTQADFRTAAPAGAEVIDCPPGEVAEGLDLYVANNVTAYTLADVEPISAADLRWYHHDLSPHIAADVRDHLNDGRHIFCSPAQRDRYEIGGELVPPPIERDRFTPPRQTERHGTCSIASWQNPGKGAVALSKWAQANEPVAVYGDGPFAPRHPAIDYRGALDPADVAPALWRYRRFVFLPFAFEPFCRCVIEAWMAGCEVVTNGLVGALWWMRERPEAIETAADDFWSVVLA